MPAWVNTSHQGIAYTNLRQHWSSVAAHADLGKHWLVKIIANAGVGQH